MRLIVALLLLVLAGCGSSQTETPSTTPKLDFTGLRGVLAGKWERIKDRNNSYFHITLTEKSIEAEYKSADSNNKSNYIAKYEKNGDMLTITDRYVVNKYAVEFLSDSEIALAPEPGNSLWPFGDLAGQWRRISYPPGWTPPKTGPTPPETGPIADAKRQVQRIEQKRSKVESVLEAALADRDELVTKLRAVGVNSPADLKGNVRGQRLAENIAKIGNEISGLERQLASIDTELLKAKELVRRMEREQAGISEDEMRKLAEKLKEIEERTDGAASTPTTPLDVEAAVEKALKATPKSTTPKKMK